GAGIVDAYGAYLNVKPVSSTTTSTSSTTSTVPIETTTTTSTTTTTTTLPTTTKCWDGTHQYLRRNSDQARKFCKCAASIYDYESYSRISLTTNAYQYLDTGNNENWETVLIPNYGRPIHRVKCTGNWYYANQTYFV
ncbi:MAG: hypothetical protein AABW46_01690, partial [Nanoarchaeota archaeon]